MLVTQTRLVDRKYVVSYTIDEDMFSSKGTLETLQEELEGLIKNWGKDTCYELDAGFSNIGLTLKGTRPATEEEKNDQDDHPECRILPNK